MDRAKLSKTCGLFAVALAMVATPPSAEAGRVVVLSVKGDDSGEFEEVLAAALDGAHEVIGSQAFERAAQRAKVDDDESPAALAKVARALEADAILDPGLTRDHGDYVLTIKVRGKNGKVKKKMTVTLDAPRLGPKGKKKVARQLLVVIDEVVGPAGKAVAPAPDDDGGAADPGAGHDNGDRGRDDDDDDPLGAAGGTAAAHAPAPDRTEVSERAPVARSPGREVRRAGILVEAGSGAMSRRLTFDSQPGFTRAPSGYHGQAVPGGHVAVDVYPLAITMPQHLAGGIGVFFEYDQALTLTTRTSEAMDVAMPTQQVRWVVGGKLRYAFGNRPTLPSLVAGVGYGRRAFIVDRSGLPTGVSLDLPDVDYRVIEPSLMLRVPLGTDRLALAAVGKGMLVQSAGAIQDQQEYGAATITGFEAEAILDLSITARILVRLRADYCRIGYAFNGNGAQTNNRDGDPDQDIGGALDRWMSGSASLAVAY